MNIPTSNTLWAGDYSSYSDYLALMDKVQQLPASAELEARSYVEEEEPDFGGYGFMVSRLGSTAVIDISGPLIPTGNFLTRMFGLTSYSDITGAAINAASDPDIESIILDFSTHGGSVEGLAETADTLRDIDEHHVPVVSFSSTNAHSAGMWLASAGREIIGTKTSNFGSVGVIAVHFSEQAALEKEGLAVTIFSAGKYKAVGNSFKDLTQADKEYMQVGVEQMYGFFISALAENRGLTEEYVRANAADGKTFYAKEAMGVSLIDGISSFQDVVILAHKSHTSPNHPQQGGI